MERLKLLLVFFFGIISFLLIVNSGADASSFPFRSINPGDTIPAVSISESDSGNSFTLDSSNAKRSVIVFWSGDGSSKEKRAIKALKTIVDLTDFFQEKNISTFIVNTGGDTPEVMNEVIAGSKLSAKVYIDSNKKAYGDYGLFVLPSLLLVDDNGKAFSGLGYSHDLEKRLKGEVEIMIGEETREQLDKELHPENKEASAEEKSSKRHFHLGETMIKRGQPEVAVKELQKVLETDPGMTEANILLGCLYLDLGEKGSAKENLAKGLEANPDSVPGQICRARLKADEGALDEAKDDLTFLLLRNARNHTLHYTLATVLEKQGKLAEAIKEYRTAYDLLNKKEMHQ